MNAIPTFLPSDAMVSTLIIFRMNKIISEDVLRRALIVISEKERVNRLDQHLYESDASLFDVPWILNIDIMFMLFCVKQEGVVMPSIPRGMGVLAQSPRLLQLPHGLLASSHWHRNQSNRFTLNLAITLLLINQIQWVIALFKIN